MVGCFSAELSSFVVQDANDTVPHSIRIAASIHSQTFSFSNYLLTALDDDAAGAGRGGCALQGVGRTVGHGHDAGCLYGRRLARLLLELCTGLGQLLDEALMAANQLIEHRAGHAASIDVALPVVADEDAALAELT